MAPREGADPFAQGFVVGRHRMAERSLPLVGTTWTRSDRLGTAAVRLGIGRYDYRVEPGIYAVGRPDESSPVLVTANYKLSFDTLRRELEGLDVFVLVLETVGINVWCAAGKGTFGTDELCARIKAVGLDRLVKHRRLILPQLGAPGVSAHRVKERTGFRVKYGPIEAKDVPHFLETGRASEEMRRKRFPIGERAVLVPMELLPALRYAAPLIAAMAVVAAALAPASSFVAGLMSHGVEAAVAVLAAALCGTAVTPLLLPWIPGRAFATKGALVWLVLGVPAIFLIQWSQSAQIEWHWLEAVGLSSLGLALASFAAMNFTGASTYTSLSGVEREMRRAVPLQAVAAIAGLLCWGLSIALMR